jgi:uncharacterized coiled-coil protein SlyX
MSAKADKYVDRALQGLIALLLAVVAWLGSQLLVSFDARVASLERSHADHEARITSRELNSVTVQQASDLQLTISKLTLSLASITEKIAGQGGEIEELKKQTAQLREALIRAKAI